MSVVVEAEKFVVEADACAAAHAPVGFDAWDGKGWDGKGWGRGGDRQVHGSHAFDEGDFVPRGCVHVVGVFIGEGRRAAFGARLSFGGVFEGGIWAGVQKGLHGLEACVEGFGRGCDEVLGFVELCGGGFEFLLCLLENLGVCIFVEVSGQFYLGLCREGEFSQGCPSLHAVDACVGDFSCHDAFSHDGVDDAPDVGNARFVEGGIFEEFPDFNEFVVPCLVGQDSEVFVVSWFEGQGVCEGKFGGHFLGLSVFVEV